MLWRRRNSTFCLFEHYFTNIISTISGVMSRWGYVRWVYVRVGYVRVGLCPTLIRYIGIDIIKSNQSVTSVLLSTDSIGDGERRTKKQRRQEQMGIRIG